MSKEKLHYNLYSYFTLNDFEEVKQILMQHHKNIDIMYENGVFFELAIVKDRPEILEILLQHTNNENIDSSKLVSILESIIEEVDLSPEMKEILSPYIDFEGSKHDTLNDSFSDIDQTTFIENFNKDAVSKNLLNEEILRKFDIETKPNNQIKTMENLLGFGDNGTHYQVEEHDTINIVLSGNLAHEVH